MLGIFVFLTTCLLFPLFDDVLPPELVRCGASCCSLFWCSDVMVACVACFTSVLVPAHAAPNGHDQHHRTHATML